MSALVTGCRATWGPTWIHTEEGLERGEAFRLEISSLLLLYMPANAVIFFPADSNNSQPRRGGSSLKLGTQGVRSYSIKHDWSPLLMSHSTLGLIKQY